MIDSVRVSVGNNAADWNERASPYHEFVASGMLDMAQCRYEQVAEKTTRITGARFVPGDAFRSSINQ